jgi:serine/threonine protein kinase
MTSGTDVLPNGSGLCSDRYRIEQVLGVGGFAITYRAFDTRLQVSVAIKEYFPEGSLRGSNGISHSTRFHRSGDGTSQFLAEARTLARLSEKRHQGIVRATDYFDESGTGYLVMELVSGETLENLLRKRVFQLNEVEGVATSMAKALMVVHSEVTDHGSFFLHQDISPSNILRTGEFPFRHVLIDFGATRMFTAEHSGNFSAIVKAGYSPLEQYAAKTRRGPETDLYALGATLYHLATGIRPAESTLRATSSVELIQPVKQLVPQMEPGLAEAISRSLQMSPDARPRSAEEFLGYIESTAARSSGATHRITEHEVRGLPKTKQMPMFPTEPGEKKKRGLAVPLGIGGAVLLTGAIAFLLTRPADSSTDVRADGTPRSEVATTEVPTSVSSEPPSTSAGSSATTTVAAETSTTPAPPPAPTPEPAGATVSVPSVNGSGSVGAKQRLQQAGLVVSQTFDYSTETAKGYVLSQNPAPGTAVAKGSAVAIVISAGMPPKPEEPTTLPPVVTIIQRAPLPPSPSPAPAPVSSVGSAEQFIRVYYDLVNAERFSEAWQLLTPSYQRKVGSFATYRSYFSSKRKIVVYGFGDCEFGGICNFRQQGSSKRFRLGITNNPSFPQINENYTR